MAKETATVAAPTVREILPLKAAAVTTDLIGHRSKTVIIDVPDEISPQDISDNPDLFRLIQKSADSRKRLNSLDVVRFVWLDKIATATVDHATADEAYFTKMEIKQRRDIDRTPYSDGQYEVRAFEGKWGAFRLRDGVRMGALYDQWQAARAEIWNLGGRTV
jgi:hypothetical protein